MPPETLAVAALIVGGAYVVFGLTGFGSTVLALPLLVQLVPFKLAVPLMLLLDFAAALMLGTRGRRGIRFDVLAWLAPFALAGIVLGLTLFIRLPERPLVGALGAFVLAYAVWGLARRGRLPPLSRLWSVPIGLVGGAASALFGTGGVLFAIYTGGRIEDKSELRATMAALILFSTSVRVALFGAAGVLSQDGLIRAALILLPALLGGFALGTRLHQRVRGATVVRVIHAVLVVAGVSLLVRAGA